MKKKILMTLLVVLVLVSCHSVKPIYVNGVRVPEMIPFSKFKGDTAAYLQTNIDNRRAYYIGKEVNILLSDMKLPVKSFIYTTMFYKYQGRGKINGMNLYFYDTDTYFKVTDTKKFIPSILLNFMPPYLDRDTTSDLIMKNNYISWSPELEKLIRKQRIEKVQYFNSGQWNK